MLKLGNINGNLGRDESELLHNLQHDKITVWIFIFNDRNKILFLTI